MIRYFRHAEIDKSAWDHCIHQAPNGLVYGYSWYLDHLCPGWDALILNDYQAVFPLPWNAKIPGFRQIFQPFFVQQLGVFSSSPFQPAWTPLFLDAIPSKFRRIQLNLNAAHTPALENKFSWSARTNLCLDLQASYEDLQQAYHRRMRAYLRKAQAEQCFVKAPLPPEELVRLYRAFQGHKFHCDEASYQRFTALMHYAIERKQGFIAGGTDLEGNLTVAGFFLQSHGRIYNVFGSSNELGRSMRSMQFMLDALIRQHAGQALILDFEGSSIPSIAKFFQSFGAKPETYYAIERGQLPLPVRWIKHWRTKKS